MGPLAAAKLDALSPYEIQAFTLAVLAAIASLIFVRYLLAEHYAGRLRLRSILVSRTMLRHQMAIAIAVTCAGISATSTWDFAKYFAMRMHLVVDWMSQPPWFWMSIATNSLEAAGILCVIRVFAPDDWGKRSWLIIVLLIGLFAALLAGLSH